jgi:hypothetical protein
LIDGNLAGVTGIKSGYIFAVIGAAELYCATGEPILTGVTGNRYFALNEQGVITQLTGSPAATCEEGAVFTPAVGALAIL